MTGMQRMDSSYFLFREGFLVHILFKEERMLPMSRWQIHNVYIMSVDEKENQNLLIIIYVKQL